MDDFYEYISHADLRPDQAAQHLDVSPATIRRWIKHGAPTIAFRALEFRAGLEHHWRGFKFRGKHVITPTGLQVAAGQIDAFEYLLQLRYEIGLEKGRTLPLSTPERQALLLSLDTMRRQLLAAVETCERQTATLTIDAHTTMNFTSQRVK